MNRWDTPVELLAPAGSEESLIAAVRCGANAVYLGGQHLNARRNAQNFDTAALQQAVVYCHARGVKVYLTLNTLVFDNELPVLVQAIKEACAAGVDAFIVQDLATAVVVRSCAPQAQLHASTQMSIHSVDGVKQLESLGFSRVIPARELTQAETAKIAASTQLEIECFVHGALCMSVSGQCAMSSIIGGRSGNRGLCAQPCRLPFTPGKQGDEHALSLRDLSLIQQIPALIKSGVRSLKIEGRMKRPEYVAAAVTACRQVLDGKEPDYQVLSAVFSRSGFTDGYFVGSRDAQMFGTRQKEDVEAAAPVLKQLAQLYKDEAQRVAVTFSFVLQPDKPATVSVFDQDGNQVTVTGAMPQQAITAPTTSDKVEAALGKTGGTPFGVQKVTCTIGPDLMLPASQLNALRREALEKLLHLRQTPQPVPFTPKPELIRFSPHTVETAPFLRVRLHTVGQLTPAILENAQEIVLPLTQLYQMDHKMVPQVREKLIVELPTIHFDDDGSLGDMLDAAKKLGITQAITGNLGGIGLAKSKGFRVYGDSGLNITNSLALAQYQKLGLAGVTASFELELEKLKALGGSLPRAMLAYGHLPLMRLRNCPIRATTGCASCGKQFPDLVDRLGNRFFVDCDGGVSTLFNCVPLFLGDRLSELKNVDTLTLYFTKEMPWECEEILKVYQTGGTISGQKTRGLYYRKVL